MHATAPASEPRLRRRQRVVAWVVSAVTIGACVAAVLMAHTPVADTAKQLAYIALAVVLPGHLVHRSLRGTQGSWLADLSLGAATGLVLELLAWLLVSVLDIRSLLWLWPVLTLPLLVPSTIRARILQRPEHGWPAGPTIAVGLACLQMVWFMSRTFLAAYELPPSGYAYYPDLLWHMGLAQEATRSFPLGTPQAVQDGTLHYHWFSNAHIAASSLITHTDIPTLMLRLWFLPVAVLMVLLTAVLGRQVSGRPWAGALAAWLVVPILTFPFWPSIVPPVNHLSPLSPSQLYSMPLTLLLVYLLVDLIRSEERPGPGSVVAALLAALGCMGSKASAMPTLLGGVGVAFLAALVLRRSRLVLLASGVVLTGLAAAGLAYVAGGSSGSGVQLLSSFSLLAPYRQIVTRSPNFTTPVLGGLVGAPGVGVLLLGALTIAVVLMLVRLASLVLPFFLRRLRRDLAAWFLAGTCAAALGPFLLLGHPGYSEYYFVYGVIPFGSVLWAWAVCDLVGDSRQRAVAASVTGVVVGLATVALGIPALRRPTPSGRDASIASLHVFLLQTSVAAAVLLGVGITAVWRRRRGGSALAPVALAAVIAPVLVTGMLSTASTPDYAAQRATERPNAELLAKGRAAAWITAHVPPPALTATNQHCLTGTGLSCDARQFWLSGLAGRRVLLEGWTYLPRAASQGSYYDPALYRLNQSAFADPTPGDLAAMRALGVGWLVGVRSKDLTVSPALATLADKRYDNGIVAVYQLR